MPHVSDVKELLKNSELKFTEIAKEVGVSPKTVQNINNGKTHRDANEVYPLRPSGQRVGELRARLSIPNKNAVPRPNVLSPQMIDYIGMLSLLGVEIDCLLTFKEAYIAPLEEIFGRKLNDSDILSIINLRPTLPPQLDTLIKAHTKPKVKFINLEYWLNSDFISAAEEGMIYSLFK